MKEKHGKISHSHTFLGGAIVQTKASVWTYDDGGWKGAQRADCVARAIAIATGLPYATVYDKLNWLASDVRLKRLRQGRGRLPGPYVARMGVPDEVYEAWLVELGFTWTATMHVGKGCTVHLKASELPRGRIICKLSKHLVTVVDGMVHDTHDCTRGGTRCVYGYWSKD